MKALDSESTINEDSLLGNIAADFLRWSNVYKKVRPKYFYNDTYFVQHNGEDQMKNCQENLWILYYMSLTQIQTLDRSISEENVFVSRPTVRHRSFWIDICWAVIKTRYLIGHDLAKTAAWWIFTKSECYMVVWNCSSFHVDLDIYVCVVQQIMQLLLNIGLPLVEPTTYLCHWPFCGAKRKSGALD